MGLGETKAANSFPLIKILPKDENFREVALFAGWIKVKRYSR